MFNQTKLVVTIRLINIFLILQLLTGCVQSQVVDYNTGVLIAYEVDEHTFPKSWKTKEVNATAVSLDTVEIERSTQLIKTALKKYPVEVLNKNLRTIYVLKSIEFYGQVYGGTNSTAIVYLGNNGVENGYTDTFVEQSFHHEFSSILLRNFPSRFKKSEWTSVNRLSYGEGGVQALMNSKDSQEFDSTFNSNGFLHEYATSSMENDFNSFAENLFMPEKEFWNLVEADAGLTKKLNVIIDFYHQINEQFTKEYFKSFLDD